jgi:hypothetical protein
MSGLHVIGEEPQDVEWTDTVTARSQEILDEIKRLAASGQLDQYLPRDNALPIFALGFVGGAIGARLLKGTVGLTVSAGVAYWAWSRLRR